MKHLLKILLCTIVFGYIYIVDFIYFLWTADPAELSVIKKNYKRIVKQEWKRATYWYKS